MEHLDKFSGLPAFPDHVPTAPLVRISVRKLLSSDRDESYRLFKACKDLGFFYLDLRSVEEGEALLREAEVLFEVGEKVFNLSLEEKSKYDFSEQKSYYGYL